jgi:hypothetical protein
MKETLDMKVTISAVATPELYRTMIGVSNPRQRAALLKRLAEDYLRGVVSATHHLPALLGTTTPDNRLHPGEIATSPLPAKQIHEGSSAAMAITQTHPASTRTEDDEHYDFLENNLTGFG